MLGCDEVERLLSDYSDGSLPMGRRLAMRFHLAMCRSCRALERSMRLTVDVLHDLRDAPFEPDDHPDDEPAKGTGA